MTAAMPAPQDDRLSESAVDTVAPPLPSIAAEVAAAEIAAQAGPATRDEPTSEEPATATAPTVPAPRKPRPPRQPRPAGGATKAASGRQPRPAPRASSLPPVPPVPASVVAAAYVEPEPEAVAVDAPEPATVVLPQVGAESPSDPAPTADAELSIEPEPRVDSEPAIVPEPAVEPDPVVEPEPEPEPEVEPEPVVDSEPAVEPELAVEPESVVELEPQPEPEPAPQPDPEPEPDTEPGSDTEPEPEPEAEDTAILAVLTSRDEPVSDEPADETADASAVSSALRLSRVTKAYGDTRAVDAIELDIPAGSFYGLVGPNGAGKTTTLSMIAGLLRPDSGSIEISGIDLRRDPAAAKRQMGILPDRLRTFDRLSGRQLLYYYGVLRGLKPAVVENRIADLARAFDLSDALGRSVSDYSTGMTKKVMLAGAMIHSPRLLVLDEPFESVDPVSSAVILDILQAYVKHGGTVVLSSHGMDLVQRACSGVAVLVGGRILASGSVDEVRDGRSLEERFLELAGGTSAVEGLEWLHTFSD